MRLPSPLLLAWLALSPAPALSADDWPQWLGPQRDGVWRESGIVERLDPAVAKVRWRTPVGAGYSGPAVANGRMYFRGFSKLACLKVSGP